ncbi:PTH1 family peptidyl-tRNA hydrolase [Bacilli bacterium PM5-3]|nr:PTH1 family peptidyl-tRNA hydrolase [Bacilli bacterium PM5-3]MDH6603321.1 PTH1 family peptidyl-tRNA hydrolase [Bacilli bacterium PM5-9]
MNSIKLIVGLGNPGKDYQKTKHNVGFMCIDKICEDNNISLDKTKFNGIYYQGVIDNQKVIILKPQTYMNLSGESVVQFVNYFNIDIDNILIIFDDMDTKLGDIRLRLKGSSGGQNGMKNIISHLKTENVPRIKIGIGRSNYPNTKDYVLSKFNKDENDKIEVAINNAAKAAIEFLNNDLTSLMSIYHKRG